MLRPGTETGLDHIGYQLSPEIPIADFARRLTDHGLHAAVQSDSQPGISRLLEVSPPGGPQMQFYEKMTAPAPGFARSGVVPTRLGHAAVTSTDPARLVRFYEDVLGFWTTDWIGDLATFLSCNRDHHGINVVNRPTSGVHHLAFELTGRAHQFEAADVLRTAGVGTVWGSSRHTVGHNLASYHHDPEGILIELYADLDIFVAELGYCEPRPWHEDLPMTPRRWSTNEISAWEADYVFDFTPTAWG